MVKRFSFAMNAFPIKVRRCFGNVTSDAFNATNVSHATDEST